MGEVSAGHMGLKGPMAKGTIRYLPFAEVRLHSVDAPMTTLAICAVFPDKIFCIKRMLVQPSLATQHAMPQEDLSEAMPSACLQHLVT
jgi:hypothetical protein